MRDAILQTKTLFISAGHSDSDPGATAHGVTESDIVLQFRNLVAAELRRKQVVFGKDGQRGENLPLSAAVTMASKHDIAVEFHCNAFNGHASGVETLSRPINTALGNNLCESISKTLGIPNRGAKEESSGQHSRLAFVSDGEGIIVELFFIDNSGDLNKYQKKSMS